MLQRTAGRAKKRILFLLAAVAVLLFLLLLLGVGARESVPGTLLTDGLSGEWDVLALEPCGDGAVLVCRGEETSLLLRLDSAGRPLTSRELPSALHWAALRGSTLFFREDGGSSSLVSCSADTLEELSRRELPWPAESLLFFDCSADGAAYGVLSGSRAVLRRFDGAEQTLTLPDSIEFLSADGVLCLFTSGALHLGSSPADLQSVPCPAVPLKLLGPGLLLDADGAVREVSEGSLRLLFRCASPVFGGLSFCSDGEKGLILSAGGGTVHRYGPTGELLGSCQLASAPLAVCEKGGVLRKGDGLYFAPFVFAEESPSPSPSPTPGPSEEAPVWLEGNLLLVPPGFTAAELRELMKPEAIHIRDLTGREVLAGRLATGMTAGDWIVVVPGDCNGTGTVTRGDLQIAVNYTEEDAGTAGYRAADLNGDGTVDGTDFLLFSDMLEE